jgi:hypothetical protein
MKSPFDESNTIVQKKFDWLFLKKIVEEVSSNKSKKDNGPTLVKMFTHS